MRKLSEKKKKNIVRVIMLIMAVTMILGFVMLPAMQSVSAEEDDTAVIVSHFETGKLSEAIEIAKDGTDLNIIKKIAVSGGTLNSDDYSAICGYPNIEFLELAGCETEDGLIPQNALSSRNQLTYISLPKNTITIGERAFSGNRALIKISIPSTLREIEDYAFEGCEQVEDFSLTAELEKIGVSAFSDCKALKSFAIPEAITEIPEFCFSKCSFTEMHIGPQIKNIGNGAFSDCHGLTDIYFYGTQAPSADQSAFQNLKVTIHTYEDGEGFDKLESNFVSIAYDLSKDSVYTPPKSNSLSETETSSESVLSEETTFGSEIQSEVSKDNASDKAETEVQPVSAQNVSGFSTISVIVISVLCLIVGILVTLLIVNKKK